MAKSKKSRRRRAGGNGFSPSKTAARNQDAEALLRADHRKVEKLFKQFEDTDDERRKRDLAGQACRELVIHSMLEEGIFYPACREKKVESEVLDEAQVEHDSVKLLVAELVNGARDPFYEAKATVLSEYVNHHVKEEEKPGSGIFARARKAGVDMVALGERLRQAREEIQERAGEDAIPPSRPRALNLGSGQGLFNRNEEMEMPRDRDERGRFMDEDDDRGSSRGRSSRGRYEDDDNGGGRGRGGWFGDSEGHSQARQQRGSSSGRYEDDDDDRSGRGGRSGGGRDRDESGRFMSDDDDRGGRGGRFSGRERDVSGRFMSDDDNGRGGRGSSRGEGRGWFGDSEGHARAAQQRGSSSGRYADDDDDRGGRGGRGGRSGGGRDRDESGRFMSDDDDNGRGGRGSSRSEGRGWFGDPEDRSRASREGWEDRESSRSSSRSRSDEDDYRGGRSSGRGHGGWFGDSRGHSEASRRGWRDRD